MPTFLHAADLHIDSPLRGLDGRESAAATRIREASRVALARMVEAAISRRVDFVLLAGDIYDTRPAFETYLFFHREMDRLSRAGIPVAIVLGNHDHEGVAPRAGRLPDQVHVLPHERPASLQIVPGVWVHGQSFPRRDVSEDLTDQYPAAVPGALNIGLLHTALDGHSGEHARYAPSRSERLSAHGYQYWALGHVHATLVLREGGCHIVYPGNLQGRHARETGPKGAVFVDYEAAAIRAVEHVAFDDVRWHRVALDPGSLDESADPLKQIAARVRHETARCRSEGRLAAVRLSIAGSAPAALVELGEDEIRDSLRAMLSTEDAIYVEKIELDLEPRDADLHESDRYLAQLIDELADSPELAEALGLAWRDARDKLRSAGGPELVEAYRANRTTPTPRAQLLAALPLARELLRRPGGSLR